MPCGYHVHGHAALQHPVFCASMPGLRNLRKRLRLMKWIDLVVPEVLGPRPPGVWRTFAANCFRLPRDILCSAPCSRSLIRCRWMLSNHSWRVSGQPAGAEALYRNLRPRQAYRMPPLGSGYFSTPSCCIGLLGHQMKWRQAASSGMPEPTVWCQLVDCTAGAVAERSRSLFR